MAPDSQHTGASSFYAPPLPSASITTMSTLPDNSTTPSSPYNPPLSKMPLEVRRNVYKAAAKDLEILELWAHLDKCACHNDDDARKKTHDAENNRETTAQEPAMQSVFRRPPTEEGSYQLTFSLINPSRLAFLAVSKETRNESILHLPVRLPAHDPQEEIRLHPSHTAVYIKNFEGIHNMVWNSINSPAEMCPNSYIGQKITTLLVDFQHFVYTMGGDGRKLFWTHLQWEHILTKFFPDVRVVAAYFHDMKDCNVYFDEEEYDSEDSDYTPPKDWPYYTKTKGGSYTHRSDPPRLQRVIADMFENVMDTMSKRGVFERGNRVRPVFKVQEYSLDNKLDLIDVDVRPRWLRPDFTKLAEECCRHDDQ